MRKLLLSLVSLVAATLVGAAALGWWAQQPLVPAPGVAATIATHSNVASVERQLRSQRLPLPPYLFQLLVRLSGNGAKLKAGAYKFEAGLSPLQIVDKIARGDVEQYALTVIEGWEFRKMRAAVDAAPQLEHRTAGLTDAELMRAIGAAERAPEGLFFPDTYLYPPGTTDLELYQRAYQRMQHKLDTAWHARAPGLPVTTPYQALILASIVEKETGREADRPMIAAVFVNRLQAKMPLQTDPTVIYGMGAKFDGNLRKKDLKTDTRWNTYTRTGLPPTPIALPGDASLKAALSPANSDALYFVARGDGSSQFSATLADHNRAVDAYQRARAH